MDELLSVLQLPERCLVNKKITKAFFKRNFDLTGAEKMLLDDAAAITNIDWLATVSPTNANILRLQDEQWLYEEVQIISVQTGEADFDRNQLKITDLVQKYIPYPILLCVYRSQAFVLNTADKKINQNDNTRRTIDKKFSSQTINRSQPTNQQQSFLASLAFGELDKTNLKTYYDGFSQRMVALQAAQLSGFFVPRTHIRSKNDMEMLEKIDLLEKEMQLLQNMAQKESQLSGQVALNIEIQQKRKQVEQLKVLIIA